MPNFKRFLVAAILSASGFGNAIAGEYLFTTEESPPYNMMAGDKMAGIATDKVVEMMKRAKLPYRIEMLPWARAYQLALEQSQTCVFSTTRTQEREPRFKWVGPLAYNSWMLYGLAERKFHLKTLEDARSLRIGTYNADVRDTYLRDRKFTVDTAIADAVNPRKLLMQRIDLWASGPFEARSQIEANHWTDKIVPVLTFNRVELYLACNPEVSGEDIDRMNVTLQGMDNDGTSTAIERRYEKWPR
ncbi:MAG: ABC transporter substrate-binding protein [Burkholderiaceae bacterium]|nr:ABC transporter substrate-binding protein [Burkholderiaceae bacterium]